MVISPATERLLNIFIGNSFALITLPSNLIFLLSNFVVTHVSLLNCTSTIFGSYGCYRYGGDEGLVLFNRFSI